MQSGQTPRILLPVLILNEFFMDYIACLLELSIALKKIHIYLLKWRDVLNVNPPRLALNVKISL